MAAAAPASPARILDEAAKSLSGGDPARWVAPVEQVLRQQPGDPRAWQIHGLLQRDLDRRELALPSLQRAAQLAPQNPQIALALARTLREAGLPSLDAYGTALRLAPGNPDILLDIAGVLVGEGRIAEARRGLTEVLKRSPHWSAGHNVLSQLRWLDGEREGFTSSFDEALSERPADLSLRRDQLLTLMHAEQYDAVLQAVAEGRRQAGEQLLFDLNEAIALAEMGELERADALFARLPESSDSALGVRRVRHLIRSARLDEAVTMLDRWLASDDAAAFWPYAAAIWRAVGDPRWQWLEGDSRFVGVYDIADRLPDLEQLAAKLRTLHTTQGQPLVQSVRGGTQTDGNLFHLVDPIIVELREAIRSAVEEHVAQLPGPDAKHPLLGTRRAPIGFSGAWSVRLSAGGQHASHVHPMGWLSSALYIVLPPDIGQEGAGLLTLGEAPPQLGLGLPPLQVIEPRPGRLALFPSTMWHGTRPFSEGERMTVAFDVAVPR